MKILLVAGARPNFVKLYPLYKVLKSNGINPIILHTGQHYDYELSQAFFEDFNLPQPDIYLGVGSDTNVQQIAKIISLSENILKDIKPDLVVVFGDVNSTLALAVSTKHLNLKLAHVEAGLRSGDWTMPEEINRVTTDALSDYLFSPSYDATENLLKEGKDPRSIFTVGNIMIDSLIDVLPKAKNIRIWEKFGLREGSYITLTLHRPSNVDEPEKLKENCRGFKRNIEGDPGNLPHPSKNEEKYGIERYKGGIFGISTLKVFGIFVPNVGFRFGNYGFRRYSGGNFLPWNPVHNPEAQHGKTHNPRLGNE
jgi:UDP-N-acetylglucosamine 2-epimerase